MRLLVTLFVVLFSSIALNAQWSDDFLDNKRLGSQSDSATASLITYDLLGNYYVLYFTQVEEPLNFELYLQKFDKDGNELWQENGIKIKNTEFDSWISNSSLKCDNDNNVIIAIEDNRDEAIDRIVTLYKISPDGNYLWSENGIQLPGEQGYLYFSPQLLITKDKYLVISDKTPTDEGVKGFPMYILDKEGSLVKTLDFKRTYEDSLIEIGFPFIFPADNDNFYFSWSIFRKQQDQDDSVYGGWGQKSVLLQKFDLSLNQLWNDDLTLINPDLNQSFRVDYPVTFVPDNDGGLFWAWHDNREFTANVFVNHIDKNDKMMFDTDGKKVQELPEDCSNLYPSILLERSDNSLYVLWIQEKIKNNYRGLHYSEYGIWGNKLNQDGKWDWSDSGSEVMLTECYFEPYILKLAEAANGRIIMFYTNEMQTLEAALINQETGKTISFAILSADTISRQFFASKKLINKDYFEITGIANNQWVATWTDKMLVKESDDIYPISRVFVQNLNTDGSIGPNPTGIIEKKDETEKIFFYPNPANNELTINIDESIEVVQEANIYNSVGKIVLSFDNLKISNNSFKVNIQTLNSGTYFLKFNIGDKQYSIKFVK